MQYALSLKPCSSSQLNHIKCGRSTSKSVGNSSMGTAKLWHARAPSIATEGACPTLYKEPSPHELQCRIWSLLVKHYERINWDPPGKLLPTVRLSRSLMVIELIQIDRIPMTSYCRSTAAMNLSGTVSNCSCGPKIANFYYLVFIYRPCSGLFNGACTK